ncbi:hypothetical protein GJ496_010333 [Pomphorhynchus laevis]|nr:hypothetical protein GJ496_010333 [Pomphorhynchus laevis]
MLKFHTIHGRNVKLDYDRRSAIRTNGYNGAILFLDRTLPKHGYFRMLLKNDYSSYWIGQIRIGICSLSPSCLIKQLPLSICPYPNYRHMVAISPLGCINRGMQTKQDDVVLLIVNINKHTISVNGEIIKNMFNEDKVWLIIDLYGISTSLQILDDEFHQSNEETIDANKNIISSSSTDLNKTESIKCVICQDAKAFHIAVPCTHKILCDDCLAIFKVSEISTRCPLCRHAIKAIAGKETMCLLIR